ncbi:MAG: hypothetical protein DU429_00230 [Candidatus Tokpelaia sp.]|nr:MAG: hypothetical protein DU430_04175 [Candidatus Tokpelaia sp.]KAA6207538.1 MAG: hypothetical protein DU429_00230 [Candidatus Tokpelaia sp.]KAA6404707.1 hypothetical protein DPQ22_07160 [Candidatus Tokpelaia sp.]
MRLRQQFFHCLKSIIYPAGNQGRFIYDAGAAYAESEGLCRYFALSPHEKAGILPAALLSLYIWPFGVLCRKPLFPNQQWQ